MTIATFKPQPGRAQWLDLLTRTAKGQFCLDMLAKQLRGAVPVTACQLAGSTRQASISAGHEEL